MAGLKSCNRPQIVLSRVQIQMLNDTERKCCTQKILICFFHPSPVELCQLVSHQLVSLCLALECNQHLKRNMAGLKSSNHKLLYQEFKFKCLMTPIENVVLKNV